MAFQPVNNTVSVEIVFEQDGVAIENVFHFTKPAGYTLADILDLADEVDGWVASDMLPLISSEMNYVKTVVTGLENANDFQTVVGTSAGAGGGGSNILPANVSKAFTFRSGLTGRSARGRMYFPGLHTGLVLLGNQTVTQTFVDDVIEALEALQVLIEALSWIWVVVSRITNGVSRTEGATFPVTSFGVSDLTLDSMRGRMPKG